MENVGKTTKRVYSDYQKKRRKEKSRAKKLLKDRTKDLGLKREIVEYFLRVQTSLSEMEKAQDKELKEQMIINVCEQIKESVLEICTHNIVSKTIEKVILIMDLGLIENFLSIIKDFIEKLMSHQIGSYVIQTTLLSIRKNNIYEHEIDIYPNIKYLLKYINENIIENMSNIYTNHITSCYIEIIGGIKKVDDIKIYIKVCKKLPKYYIKKLKDILERYNNYINNGINEWNSNFIKSSVPLIYAVKYALNKKIEILIADLLKNISSELIFDQNYSFLLQAICNVMNDKNTKETIEKKYITPNIKELLTHTSGNFVLQAYLTNVNDEKEANKLIEYCSNELDTILNAGNFQVIARFIDMAINNKLSMKKCENLVFSILSSFQFETIEPSFQIILQILATEIYDESNLVISDVNFTFNLEIL